MDTVKQFLFFARQKQQKVQLSYYVCTMFSNIKVFMTNSTSPAVCSTTCAKISVKQTLRLQSRPNYFVILRGKAPNISEIGDV